MKLLNSNYKLKKALNKGIVQMGVEMLPYTFGGGENLCKFASKDCIRVCVEQAGHSSLPVVYNARLARTQLFNKDNVEFLRLLINEINYYSGIYSNLTIRPNVFSEIQWKDIFYEGKNLFQWNENVTFMDYVKNKNSVYLDIPNYFTLYSGQVNTKHIWLKLLKDSKPVALVFNKVPEEYEGYQVVNGDEDDYIIRYKDKPVIVGLKYKQVIKKGVRNSDLLKNNKLVIQL
jgi:hypothetical protein